MNTIFTATAPAKLIVTGEHSIVYGAPAISIAIDQRITTTVGWNENSNKQNCYNNPFINFNLSNLEYFKPHTLEKLMLLKRRLQNNYLQFLKGNCSIKEVIKKPFELLQFLVTSVIERLHLQISRNLYIQVHSDIPIGSGLGSSAACIISCLYSLTKLFKVNWDPKKLFNIANDIENLQHGNSSGIDLYTIMFGGCNYFPENYRESFNNNHANNYCDTFDKVENINLTGFDFKIVNTGKPAASTGECVSMVKQYFLRRNSSLVKEFSQATIDIKRALLAKNQIELIDAIRLNHALLSKIGVVPEKTQKFIKAIEQAGGAGKICGAGSVRGDNAGVVMLLGDLEKINKVVAAYGYLLQEVHIDHIGVTVA
jgi:mevalonate kinase